MSKLNNKNIKDLLSKTTVDMDLDLEWDAIASKMDKKKRKRRGFWWIFGLFIFGVITGYFLSPTDDINPNSAIVNESKALNEVHSPQNETSTENDRFSQNKNFDNINNSEKSASNRNLETTNNSSTPTKKYTPSKPVDNNTSSNLIVETKHNNASSINSSNYQTPGLITNNKDENIINDKNNEVGQNPSLEQSISPIIKDQKLTQNQRTTLFKLADIRSINYDFTNEDRELDKPKLSPFEFIKPSIILNKYIYADLSLSSVNINIDPAGDEAYAQLLSNDFTVLSKLESSIGLGKYITPNWRLNIGIKYDQYRSVYRGEIQKQETSFITKDSAAVFINSVGGNVYQEGEVTRIKTTKANIQQYNYQHSIGLNLGLRYNFYGPFYAGTDILWRPIQWQSGQIVSPNEEIESFDNLVSDSRKFHLGLDLGLNLKLSRNIGIEAGFRYQPTQYLYSMDEVKLSAHSIGGQVRLIYGI